MFGVKKCFAYPITELRKVKISLTGPDKVHMARAYRVRGWILATTIAVFSLSVHPFPNCLLRQELAFPVVKAKVAPSCLRSLAPKSRKFSQTPFEAHFVLKAGTTSNEDFCEECLKNSTSALSISQTGQYEDEDHFTDTLAPRVTIEYCTGCRWLLRAGWTAQELLTTFEKELAEVAIRPGKSTGVFNVWVGNSLVWNRTEIRRFPEMKELKQKVRDIVNPERGLGHSDK
jgi:selenoprotein W-related protein